MTDAFKKMDDAQMAHNIVTAAGEKQVEDAPCDDAVQFKSHDGVFHDVDGAPATSVASSVTGATIVKSDDGAKEEPSFETAKEEPSFEMPDVEDVSDGEDWSVISDEA